MVKKVISGGQTGVDRAALDVARQLGIDHGGWCPRGRRAEDGIISAEYQLRETESRDYAQRTELNVRESDGTLILYQHSLSGGTKLTRNLAIQFDKPLLLVDLETPEAPESVNRWVNEHVICSLNVAGPRESGAPGIAKNATSFLISALQPYQVRSK